MHSSIHIDVVRPTGEIKVTVKDVHPYTLWRVARLEVITLSLARASARVLSMQTGHVAPHD